MNAHRTIFLVVLLTCCLFAGACQSPHNGPYAPQADGRRNPIEAQRLTMKAVEVLDGDGDEADRLVKAESLLREALSADLYHGPAHNNLAVVYLKQARLYEAAGECEWARKLMPGAPDPRVNLAIILERAGRTSEALASYRTALEVYPEHIQAMQGLARLQLRRSKADDDTPRYLKEIALRGTSPEWREWAQRRLAHLDP
jgi:Flp pilus assembly protein TadD